MVCLKSLPGGSWERPWKGPPGSTKATPPSPRHTRKARPKSAPLAHRQEQGGVPKHHGSRTGASPTPLIRISPCEDEVAAPQDGPRFCASLLQGVGTSCSQRIGYLLSQGSRFPIADLEWRRLGHLNIGDDGWLHGQNGNSLGRSRCQHRQPARWARGCGRANSLPRHDGRLNGGVSLRNSPHDNLCRLSPLLGGTLCRGRPASEARRGIGCRS
jgi:hypothetical protein